MRIIFDLEHPGHVHTFRNTIKILKSKGHKILVLAKEKEVSLSLLKGYNIKYRCIGKYKESIIGKFFNLFLMDLKYFLIAKKFKPDLIVSATSPYSAHVSKLLNVKHVAFLDSEPTSLILSITLPFVDVVVTPIGFKRKLKVKKHIKINSFKELAYLHPNYFKPNPNVLKKQGLNEKDIFFILRFVSFNASHDIGIKGFDLKSKRKLITFLEKKGRVLISSEKPIEPEFREYKVKINPEEMHDLLHYAALLIGDTQTMTTEAAILGTPALRCNSFVGPNDMSNFIELEKKYDLIYSYKDFNRVITKAEELLSKNNLKSEWKIKRDKLLDDKIDLSEWMVRLIENFDD
jgi:uncharacterized protein